MKSISVFAAYGARFRFEPPVEVDDSASIKSIGDIAAAASGYNVEARPYLAESVNLTMDGIVDALPDGADKPEHIAGFVQKSLRYKHVVSVIH